MKKSQKGNTACAKTRTCDTDSPSKLKSRALSITPLHHPQKKDGSMTNFQHTQSDPHGSHFFQLSFILTPFFPKKKNLCSLSTLEGGVLKRLTACNSGAGKMSERTLEGGASRGRGTSSDDSRVDRIACAGSPSLSPLFLRMVQWRDG